MLASIDFEAPWIEDGVQAPPPCAAGVCGPVPLELDPWCARAEQYERGEPIWLVSACSPQWPRLLEWMARGPGTIVNQRAQFDYAVLLEVRPDLAMDVFDRYERGGVECTELREKLLDVARGMPVNGRGGYSLAALAGRYGLEVGEKGEGGVRTRYYEFYARPIAQWPEEARHYLALDARTPLEIYHAQAARAPRVHDLPVLADAPRQALYHFALELVRDHGVVGDRWALARYREEVGVELERARQLMLANGRDVEILRRSKKLGDRVEVVHQTYGYEDKKGFHLRKQVFSDYVAEVWQRLDMPGPRTPKGACHPHCITTGEVTSGPGQCTCAKGYAKDATAAEASGDDLFQAFQACSSLTTAMSKVDELEPAGSGVLHTTYDLVETGRTSSWGPNLQNRTNKTPTDRACMIPRPGHVYVDIDVDGLELASIAQVCLALFGYSRMAAVIRTPGGDPHLFMASQMPQLRHLSYEEIAHRYKQGDKEIKKYRQMAKPANFGFPGGLGIKKFVAWAWQQHRARFTEAEAHALKEAWLSAWPEMCQYLDLVGRQARGGSHTVVQLYSQRIRGGCGYCDGANTRYQGLGADATKWVTARLTRACLDPASVLYGCRVVLYIHDQWLVEVPEDVQLMARIAEIERIVREGCRAWLPDVPPGATGIPCRRWSKDARRLDLVDGSAVPWEWAPAVDAWVETLTLPTDPGPAPRDVVRTALHVVPDLTQVASVVHLRRDLAAQASGGDADARVDHEYATAWLARARVLGAA